MKIILHIYIILIAFLCACNQVSQKDDKCVFPIKKKLTTTEVKIEGKLMAPGELMLKNDIIVVYDVYSDFVFHVFSKNDFRSLGSVIRRGRGPEEEILVYPYFRFLGNDTIMYQNHRSIKFARFDNKADGLAIQVFSQIELPEELRFGGDFFLINDTLFSSIGGIQKTTDFQGYCWKTGNVFDRGSLIPLKTQKSPNQEFDEFIVSASTVKPDKSLIATLFLDIPLLRVYSSSNWKLKAECQIENKSGSLDYSGQYWRIRSTDNFIYGLFSDIEPPALERDGDKFRYSDVASEIHLWDWDGNPVMKLKFERPVFSFDVTADDKQIIAISIADVDKLFVAEIPWD